MNRIGLFLRTFLATAVILLAFVISNGCNSGFKTMTPPPDDVTPQATPTPTPHPPGSSTTTTSIIPPPTTTTLPKPPGGHIYCAQYGGRFSTAAQIIAYANATGDSSCIKLNDQSIRGGFGPCVGCYADGWTTPTPTPTPAPTTTTIPGTTTTRPPTTTTLPPTTTTRPPTTTTGWPTTTTKPGSP